MKKSKFSEEQIAYVLARWCGVGHRLRIALHCGGRGCPMNLRCFAFGVASSLFLQATSVAQQEMFFDSGGVRIRYLEAGKGLPVVLVHGHANALPRGLPRERPATRAATRKLTTSDAL